MVYKLKMKAFAFDAADDLDAVIRAQYILHHVKFTLYGSDNEAIAVVGFDTASDEELDFEFDCPEMDDIYNRGLAGLSRDARNFIRLRCNSHDCEDIGERHD